MRRIPKFDERKRKVVDLVNKEVPPLKRVRLPLSMPPPPETRVQRHIAMTPTSEKKLLRNIADVTPKEKISASRNAENLKPTTSEVPAPKRLKKREECRNRFGVIVMGDYSIVLEKYFL